MEMSYFIIEKGIVERTDLSIYEKMCCVVLAKWATEELQQFDMVMLAEQMSCTLNKAKETISLLKQKGFIQSEEKEEREVALPKIIKAKDVEGLEPVKFNETASKNLSREELLEEVRQIIDEAINDSEARILLSFANDDIERIRNCYKKARNLQVVDKIEALMMELQKKEEKKEQVVEVAEVAEENKEEKDTDKKVEQASDKKNEEKPWYLDDEEDDDEVIKPPQKSQINTHVINKMKSYKNYGK